MKPTLALSLKQPWATLLVWGIKSIEVRAWPTGVRGRVLIHAARVPDERPEGWWLVPPELEQAAQLGGGIIGAADLVNCQPYTRFETFLADHDRHRNEPAWYKPGLFGLHFARPERLPFRRLPGQTRFFTVKL